MNGVTTDAGCDFLLSGLEQPAVNARVVFAFLIDSQRGIEFLHQVRITMTFAAVCWNVECLWLSEKTLRRILRCLTRVGIRIAPMTIIARQATSTMDVVGEISSRVTQARIVQPHVAIDAGAFLLRGRQSEQRQDRNDCKSCLKYRHNLVTSRIR